MCERLGACPSPTQALLYTCYLQSHPQPSMLGLQRHSWGLQGPHATYPTLYAYRALQAMIPTPYPASPIVSPLGPR